MKNDYLRMIIERIKYLYNKLETYRKRKKYMDFEVFPECENLTEVDIIREMTKWFSANFVVNNNQINLISEPKDIPFIDKKKYPELTVSGFFDLFNSEKSAFKYFALALFRVASVYGKEKEMIRTQEFNQKPYIDNKKLVSYLKKNFGVSIDSEDSLDSVISSICVDFTTEGEISMKEFFDGITRK